MGGKKNQQSGHLLYNFPFLVIVSFTRSRHALKTTNYLPSTNEAKIQTHKATLAIQVFTTRELISRSQDTRRRDLPTTQRTKHSYRADRTRRRQEAPAGINTLPISCSHYSRGER